MKKFLSILLFAIIIMFPSVLYLLSSPSSNPVLIISGILGITAYALFLFQLLLAARIKQIDRIFGLDKLYRFHMVIAPLAIAFAIIHKIIKESYYSESFKTQIGEIALIIFIAISVFSILLMIKKLFFKMNLVDAVRKFLNDKIKIKHQNKVLIHNLVLVALVLLFIHILLAFSVKSNLMMQIVMILYFAIAFAAYFNRKVLQQFRKSNSYIVSETIEENKDIITLKLQPETGEIFNYLPGQFLYINLLHPGIPTDEHPFTISSNPLQKEFISVTVKKLGDFTNKLNLAEVGTKAFISGAYGTFSYCKKSSGKKLCFIAGGIGITPYLSMLRHMSMSNQDIEVILLWGIRNQEDMICGEEFNQLMSKLPGFQMIPVFSDDKNSTGEKGYIDKELIKKYTKGPEAYEFYICGPPIMLEMQLKNLKALGVKKNKIFFERFSI